MHPFTSQLLQNRDNQFVLIPNISVLAIHIIKCNKIVIPLGCYLQLHSIHELAMYIFCTN
jgi:hypothetical protein